MSNFEEAVKYVLSKEGELQENKNDLGGITKFGISLRLLKNITPENLKKYRIFTEVDENCIRNLTVEQAKAIYEGEFWVHAPFGKIQYQPYCNYIFDMAINMGIAAAIKCAQRATWAVMKKWELMPDDGILGERTLEAIKKCGMFLNAPLRAERANYYRAVINTHPEQKENWNGWLNRTYDA